MIDLMQVDEFCRGSYISSDLNLHNNEVLIMWQWIDSVDEEEQSNFSDGGGDDTLSTDSDINEDEEEREVENTVVKCIGVTRDVSYQDRLQKVNVLMQQGKEVPVKMVPEPTNPFDSRVISFQCELDKQWCIIGYVIKELCDSVHCAITSESIVSCNFAWVKYKVLNTTGPGYYAAINVTRKGYWPPIVYSRANTMI